MVKHIVVQLIKFLFIVLPLELLGLIVVAVALIPTLRDRRILQDDLQEQRLSSIFRWFDVGDTIDQKYGLNGDLPYQLRFLDGDIVNPSAFKVWRMRYNWLALRNPLNWFQYNVLGIASNSIKKIESYTNEADGTYFKYIAAGEASDTLQEYLLEVPEVGNWWNAGKRQIIATLKDGTEVREYYVVVLYPKWIKRNGYRLCMRVRVGHKLGHNPLDQPRDRIQWTLTIGLANSYLGKV